MKPKNKKIAASAWAIIFSLFFNAGIYKNLYNTAEHPEVIIDSNYTLSEAVSGKKIPAYIKNNLRIVSVLYYSFDGKLHRGQFVINKYLVEDIKAVFDKIKNIKFPVEKVIPVVKYDWSDDKSMKDNNSSAFNYRTISGTQRLSIHAFGRAVDINPKLNPQFKHGHALPSGSEYKPGMPGTLTNNSLVVKEFKRRKWSWGGNWRRTKDYQHFEKK